jgi:hypothetical protein
LAIGQNISVHVNAIYGPISGKTGIRLIPEKEAAGWPLLPDYRYYMGPNSGVFFKTGFDLGFYFSEQQSDGLTAYC